MARKTKKQKKAAELRRHTAYSPQKIEYSLTDIPSLPKKKEKTPIVEQPHLPTTIKATATTQYLYRDIQKVILVAGFLFSVEFVIFWIIEHDGARFLQSFIG